MFCDAASPHACDQPSAGLNNLAADWDLNRRNLSTLPPGQPHDLLHDFNRIFFSNPSQGFQGAAIGGIPLVRVEGGNPQIPQKSLKASYNALSAVLQVKTLGIILDPMGRQALVGGAGCNMSPLMIDFSGKGIALSSQGKGAWFDIDGDANKERISWPLRPDDAGILCLDKNRDGQIADVHELFGNATIGPDGKTADNGFEALRKYDSNSDGRIDSTDEIWPELRLWFDRDRDGKVSKTGLGSSKKELLTLAEAGLENLDLGYNNILERDYYGNEIRQSSVARRGNGTRLPLVDVWFLPGIAE